MEVNIERNMLAETQHLAWWAVLLRGIFAVLFGIAALVWPVKSLAVLVALFGIFALAHGIVSVIAAVATPEGRKRWWALIAAGIVAILAGIAVFVWPGITVITLLFIIAIWAIIDGVLEISAGLSGGAAYGAGWTLALAGVFSVLFGILLFAYPLPGLLAVIWLIGFYALLWGVTLIAFAFHVRGYQERMAGRPITQP